jgi:hypothetical protein
MQNKIHVVTKKKFIFAVFHCLCSNIFRIHDITRENVHLRCNHKRINSLDVLTSDNLYELVYVPESHHVLEYKNSREKTLFHTVQNDRHIYTADNIKLPIFQSFSISFPPVQTSSTSKSVHIIPAADHSQKRDCFDPENNNTASVGDVDAMTTATFFKLIIRDCRRQFTATKSLKLQKQDIKSSGTTDKHQSFINANSNWTWQELLANWVRKKDCVFKEEESV